MAGGQSGQAAVGGAGFASGAAGSGGAASTAFFVSPAEDLIMIFLTQLLPSSSYPIRRELRAAVYQAIRD